MMWDKWVIDASMSAPDGMFCFCPLDGDDIVTGFNFLGAGPPGGGELVGVVHPDGDEAVENFYARHQSVIELIRENARRK